MDNIEFLLQSLDAEIEVNNDPDSTGKTHPEIDSFTISDIPTENNAIDLLSGINKHESTDNFQKPVESVSKDNHDFTLTKKQLSSKYSGSGNEIHRKLKESERTQYNYKGTKNSTWSTNKTRVESRELAVSNSGVKQDVYAEPVFGLRLINPIVSSSLIQSKMSGRHPVSVSNIPNHLRCGDKNSDWVFAGAVVFKSGLKTSQKGSQYCLWKISDLKNDLKQVTLYLFGKACSELWKVSLGTVAAVLNATPFYKDEKASNDEVTLTIKSADQVMIWGGSRDYGLCKALKKNGEKCTSFVNKSNCEFCVYHVKKEYSKYASSRSNLQAPSIGLTNLRNKILGKSEVFYAGKSYTAVSVPKQNNSAKKNSFAENPALSTVRTKLRESDQRKLEKLNVSKSRSVPVTSTENRVTERISPQKLEPSISVDMVEPKTLSKQPENVLQSKTKCSSTLSPMTSPSLDKPIYSRLHLFKQAGAKMQESGEVTRISFESKDKKVPCFSFSDVLANPPSPASPIPRNAKENVNKEKKITLNKTDNIIDFSVDIRKSLKINNSSVISNERNKSIVNKKTTSPAYSSKLKSKPVIESAGPSKILQDFKNLTKTAVVDERGIEHKDAECASKTPDANQLLVAQQDSSNRSEIMNDRTVVRSLMQHVSSPSSSIHDRKKARNIQNAISLIKKKGGIAKMDPNQVRSDPNRRKSVKRSAETSDTEEAEEERLEKSVLSQRFVDLMNTTSKHENLVQIAEDVERQDYFNKMEKKEQLEEKMLATYKVPCKAVICLKCKYKWFSASDLCRAEGHPIKVIETVKRYFKCDNCTNRTVSLEVVPLVSCKLCGASKWSRAGMIKEKLAKNENRLSIRGDEIKFLDSLSHSMNINLLVPDDK